MADGGVSWPSDLELKLNLNAIKKRDQFVVNIIDTASQVALYKFKSETQAWEKTDVEGALFVYMRSSLPKYSFFIMNRLNMNNIAEAVTKDIEFKQQDPFLLFRNKTSGIYGIWFYDSEECTRLSNLLIRLSMEEPETQQRPTSNPELNHKQTKEGIDILSMLTNAQEKYEKKTTEPPKAPVEQKPPLEDRKQHFLQQNQDQLEQLKQMIKGNEPVKVKQRAYSTPAPYKPPSSTSSFPPLSENGLSNMKLPYENQNSLKTQILPAQMFASPDRSSLPRRLFPTEKQENVDNTARSSDQSVTLAASLMSPMAFKTSGTSPDPPPKATPKKPEISPLTSDQLVQAMAYLMKNDSDFVKKLHEAYLKSLHDLLPT